MSVRTFSIAQIAGVSAVAVLLAAVLVPLGEAQGGTRGDAKSWHLTQLRQLGLNFVAYSHDWNGVLPLAFTQRPDGSWAHSQPMPSPADVVANAPWQDPERINQAQGIWRNALSAYSPAATFLPGAPEYVMPGDTFAGVPNLTNTTMNGLLHSYSVSSVPRPDLVPILWPGIGRINLKGRATSNPVITCSAGPNCRFNSMGPGAGLWSWLDSTATSWIFGKAGPFVRLDTSVAILPLGTTAAPDFSDFNFDPIAQTTPSGVPMTMWVCTGPGSSISFPCHFRPDRTQ